MRSKSIYAPRMDELDDAELQTIESRVRAATEGPWWSWVEGRDGTSGDTFIGRGPKGARRTDLYLSTDEPGHSITPEDHDFIAHARQDVPRLVAEVRRLRDRLNDVIRVVSGGPCAVRATHIPSGTAVPVGDQATTKANGDLAKERLIAMLSVRRRRGARRSASSRSAHRAPWSA
jgi:hypothetical protein